MKRYFYSLALALCALMLAMPVKAQDVIAVNDFSSIYAAFGNASSKDTIRLTANIQFNNHELGTSAPSLNVHEGDTRNLDLNGYALINTAYTATHNFTIELNPHSTLNIYDSKGGGSIVCKEFTTFHGSFPSAICMVRSDGCTLNVYGGTLKAYNEYGEIDLDGKCVHSAPADDHEPNIINIYGGQIYGINNYNNRVLCVDTALVVNLYGGVLGGEDAYLGLNYPKNFKGTLREGTIYGISSYKDAFNNMSALDPNTTIYVDDVLTSKEDLIPMILACYGDFLPKKVEFRYEPSVTVAGTAVTQANRNDVLGDGRVRFDASVNTLFLTSKGSALETLNGNIVFEDFDMTIVVSGNWQINGRIVGLSGNLVLQAQNPRMDIENSDKLLVRNATSTGISLQNGNVTVGEWLQLYVDDNNTHSQSVILCKKLVLRRCLLDVSGKAPVVSTESSALIGCSFAVGTSFSSDQAVRIEPEIPASRTVKAWIAGKQLTGNNLSTDIDANDPALPFQSEYVKGNVYAWFSGPIFVLDLRDVEINVRDVATWNGFTGTGVPAVEIQEDSVVVFVQNTLIWSGCPTGKKFEGVDNTYYADGSYGIYFNPTKPNNCNIELRAISDKQKPCRSLYIGAESEHQLAAHPIYCKGSRLYIERIGDQDATDSIWIESSLPVKCATGLSFHDVNIYSKKGYVTSNTPELSNCYIAWPRAANFNNTGGVKNSTDNANEGITIRNINQYPLSLFAEINDGDMGRLWCGNTSCTENPIWDEEVELNCTPFTGYKFKEWQIYCKGKSSVETIPTQHATIQLRSNARCVAVMEQDNGDAIMYPLYINGTQISSANCMNPVSDKKSYYNPDRNGIYLDNVNWSFSQNQAIEYTGTKSFLLQLAGTNNVYGTAAATKQFTMNFDNNAAYFFGDSLIVGMYGEGLGAPGIPIRVDNGTLYLKNKYTEVRGYASLGIVADTLIIDEGSELYVDNGTANFDTISMPENYMIYPAGAYFSATNHNICDENGNELRTFRIALKPDYYSITTSVNDEAFGSVSGGGIYEEGAKVTLTATPNDDYEFVRWSTGSTSNPYQFDACANLNITAIFQVKSQTAIDNTQSEVKAIKILRDGQLFIDRNGQIYNAQGIKVQ